MLEVIVPTNNSSGATEDTHAVMRSLLSELQLGDEVAIKVDSSTALKYAGADDPIRSLTLIASGIGIVPVIQLLRKVYKEKGFQLDSCEVLWINSKKEDFIFAPELDKMENQFTDSLSIVRVLDVNVGSESTVLNPKLVESLPLYEPGRVSVIAANKEISNKFSNALIEKLNFSKNNIVICPM